MCNNDNSNECQCINEILKVILILQKNADCGSCCLDTCDRGFLGCSVSTVSCNTRPVMLYTCCGNGTPWSMPIEKEEEKTKPDKIDENMIINSINDEDEYVLYHVHTVGISDTIESITKKYNISVNTLKEYNTLDSLELNMKLIIPNEEL